tara:strand:+ start:7220 stop:8827 length:1608 start_codon:yes stop_codon:yes gene_type:complete
MAATIEVNYFNTFWLKKIKSITDVASGSSSAYVSNTGTTFVIGSSLSDTQMNIGQEVTFTYTSGSGDTINYSSYVVSKISGTSFVAGAAPNPAVTGTPTISFGPIINFDNIPPAEPNYPSAPANDWYIEEARIRGGYNNVSTDYGVKAYLVEDTFAQQHRISSLIYSGIFNSRTGVNDTNQFSVGESITRSLDPANGSIQRLYAEDTNLIIFQEDKVSKALIDKDAIYTAEGAALTTSGRLVIGQVVAYAGEYGISEDPYSFAVYGYRKYFTDRKRNCVCRLSMDGITEISSYGMHDFFRDELGKSSIRVVGGWDVHTKNYILSIQSKANSSYITTSYDEDVRGWTSFFSYKPTYVVSLGSNFYSFNSGELWRHHDGNKYAYFYNEVDSNGTPIAQDSYVTLVLNTQPSVVKNFKTLNYEGNNGWELDSMIASSSDQTLPITKYEFKNNLADLETQFWSNSFKKKENKFFANLINNSAATSGEVLYGPDVSGIKGFWSTVKMTIDWNTTVSSDTNYYTNKKELFSVSSDTVESSY